MLACVTVAIMQTGALSSIPQIITSVCFCSKEIIQSYLNFHLLLPSVALWTDWYHKDLLWSWCYIHQGDVRFMIGLLISKELQTLNYKYHPSTKFDRVTCYAIHPCSNSIRRTLLSGFRWADILVRLLRELCYVIDMLLSAHVLLGV